MTDLNSDQVGPAVAGRLQGIPYNMALGLQITTQAGNNLQGDAALAYPGEPQQLDGNGNIIAAATENGIQVLMRILSRRYGADSQQLATGTIDQFYDLRRGRPSLLEYMAEFEHTYEEANRLGNLNLNNVALSH